MIRSKLVLLPIAMLLCCSCALAQNQTIIADPAVPPAGYAWVPVQGTGVHRFSTAMVHSQEPTETGFIQRSTEIVELDGDLRGRVLYHPVSIFDFASGTLVNTGDQVFSGSVLGSDPVLLHDDEFRFDVDLATGETVGRVFLENHIAGPRIRCRIQILGGREITPEGDAVVDYTGQCRVRAEHVGGAR